MSTSERVIIIGGGGFGRELISYVSDCHAVGTLPAVAGYLDDAGDVLAKFGHPFPWFGMVNAYQPVDGDLFVLGLGSPASKLAVAEMLCAKGAKFANIIHPSSLVAANAVLGQGIIVCPWVGVSLDTQIGSFVTLNSYTGIGHDASIGDFTTLSGHVDITGFARIGRDVFIGSSAVIMPRVKVGDGARVGAGSVVYRSVPPGATVYAPPAKQLRSMPPRTKA